VRLVRRALRHLYEPPALLRSPLRTMLAPQLSPEAGARFLRSALLEAVEALNPGPRVPFRAPTSRSYAAIRLHYIEGYTVEEVARELAVSERQAYRDIRKGEADVASVLWARHLAPTADGTHSPPGGTLHQELARLQIGSYRAPTAFTPLLQEACAAVMRLADQRGIRLELPEVPHCLIAADPMGLRQCLIAALSYAVQGAHKAVALSLHLDGQRFLLALRWDQPGNPLGRENLLLTAQALAEASGGRLSSHPREAALMLELPLWLQPTVLVIDDNEGLPDLFQRYLQGTPWQVLAAATAEEGLRLAHERHPHAIVLDILMPGTDGWSVLQELKANPATAHIPVLVCSVFSDPELARAQGAAAFIPKPVSRQALLQALAAHAPR